MRRLSTRTVGLTPVLLRALSIALICQAALCSADEESDDVVVLDSNNFDEFITSKPLALVEFYAPWCGHCKTLEPKWSIAAHRAKQLASPVPLAKVDATMNSDLSDRYDVNGYPTIKLFRNGIAEEYTGPRDPSSIIDQITKIQSFKLHALSKDADLAALLASSKHPVVLGLFRMPISASAAYETFNTVAFQAVGQPVTFAYSAAYGEPPVLPLTEAGKKPAVPGLLLLRPSKKGSGGTLAAAASLAMPRKREEFTLRYIANWLERSGVMGLHIEEPPDGDDEPKEYDPDDEGASHYDSDYPMEDDIEPQDEDNEDWDEEHDRARLGKRKHSADDYYRHDIEE